VRWTGEFVFAMAWLVLVLSIGAISLLTLLIRRGAANRGLFYLVPFTAVIVRDVRQILGPLGVPDSRLRSSASRSRLRA
jgi:hypothetical protein